MGFPAPAMVLLLLASCAAAACSKRAEAPPVPEPPAPAPVAMDAGPSGDWAYLLSAQVDATRRPPFATRLVAIDPAGTVSRVPLAADVEVRSIRRGGDGRAYVLATSRAQPRMATVFRIVETTLQPVAELSSCPASDDAPFDVWGEHVVIGCARGTLHERRGSAPSTTFTAPGEGIFASVSITASGTVWFGAVDGLYERTPGGWAARSLPRPHAEPLEVIEGPRGVHVNMRSSGLSLVRQSSVEPVWPSPERRIFRASSDGTVGAMAEGPRTSSRREPSPTLQLETVELPGNAIPLARPIAYKSSMDDRGRAWGMHDGELVVADGRSGAVQVVPMGGYAELDFVDVQFVVLLGRGPEVVPPARPPRRTKRITLKLAPGGKPRAGVEVELCPRRSGGSFGTESPCAGVDGARVVRARTDARGDLAVDGVTMGPWYVHWRPAPSARWETEPFMLPLTENDVSEIGTVGRVTTF